MEGKDLPPAALRATPFRGQHQRPGEAGSAVFLVLGPSSWRVGFRGEPGLGPAADLLSESRQRKGEPKSGALRASLRCSVRGGRSQTCPLRGLRTCSRLIPAPLRCSARPDGTDGSGSGLPFSQAWWIEGKYVPSLRRHVLASSAGLGGNRAAHVRRPRSGQVCADPARTEQRSVPEAKRRDGASGSPFLCLLSFGEAKESESPAGAKPGMPRKPTRLKPRSST